MVLPLLIATVAGYFLGALPFGYWVARAYGINIFEHGSKSPGATNVKRVLGKKAGNTVYALDVLKGAVAAGWPLIAWSMPSSTVTATPETLADTAGVVGLIGAVLGHSFSCFTGFRGGKGVATSAGGFVVLMPLVTLIALAVWLLVFYTSRYVSLASIAAAVAIPVGAAALQQPPVLIVLGGLIGGFVIWLHRANVKRLVAGTENRFVKKQRATSEQ